MQTRTLGASGLAVQPIGLGGMPLSISGRPSEADAIRTIHAALECGMDFIDTADVYCLDHTDIGHNERLIRAALGQWQGRKPVVATKGGLERPNGAWTRNGRPAHLQRACEASCTALGVDAITLYQLHAPDPSTPFSDSVGAMKQLRDEGKVQHVGLSNVSVAQIEEALEIVPIVSVQNRCNPFDLSAFSTGVVDFCTRRGIAFLPYSPVGGGRGKVRVANDRRLAAMAQRHQASPFEVTLAWLLTTSPVMVPIPGASKVESAASSCRAMNLQLTSQDLAELQSAFPI